MSDVEARIARVSRAYRMAILNYMNDEDRAFWRTPHKSVAPDSPVPRGHFRLDPKSHDVYDVGSLHLLEEVSDKIEAALTGPRYRVLRTIRIQEAVTRLHDTGMRNAIKEIATETHGKANPKEWIEGMRMMASWAEACPSVFWAETAVTLFIFRGKTEEEILAKMSEVREKKRVPTPEKVLSKMVAGRLRKLKGAVATYNKAVNEANETNYRHAKVHAYVPKANPTICWTAPTTVQAFLNLRSHVKEVHQLCLNWDRSIEQLILEVSSLIESKGVGDLHLTEACDLLLMEEVMDA